MPELNDKPRRAPRAAKRAGVAVPFMPNAAPADDRPIAAVIEEIAHLPIDTPSAALPLAGDAEVQATTADEPPASPPVVVEPAVPAFSPIIQPTTTAATSAPTEQEDDIMTDTMQNATQTMQQNAEAAMGKGKQALDDMTAFGQGNVEAMVESSRVAFKGMEAMAQARAAFAKQSFDATVQTVKAMAEVRSPADLFRLQGEYLRNSMDALVAETSRSTEATLKLVGEIAQPIQNRVAIAAEKVRTAA